MGTSAFPVNIRRKYAREVFDRWFSGRAPDEVIFDNPKWAAYMQADPGLTGQIDEHLTRYAQKVRDDVSRGSPSAKLTVSNIPYQLTFHAEVGTTYGGFKTGYAQLHGSNREAGDFQMRGLVAMAPADGGQLAVSFTGNELTFNDKVDPNFKYQADAVFAKMAKNLAAATGGRRPFADGA